MNTAHAPVPHARRARRARARLLAVLLGALALGPACGGEPELTGEAAFEAARQRAVELQDGGGDPGEVLAALQAAFALDPDHYGVNYRLGRVCSELKLHVAALDHFRRAHRARPDDHETLLAVVTLQTRLGLLDEALAALPVLEADPLYAGEARYQRASILDQRGERGAALALVADTGELPPREAYRCASLHGRFLLEPGDVTGAQQRFAAALAGRADYKEALKGMADCCRRLGEEAQAAAWDARLARFVELTDSIYAQNPRTRQARRATLEALLADYPQWTEGWPQLADLQVQLGDRAAACRTIEAFLARQPAGGAPDTAARLRARYCEGAAR